MVKRQAVRAAHAQARYFDWTTQPRDGFTAAAERFFTQRAAEKAPLYISEYDTAREQGLIVAHRNQKEKFAGVWSGADVTLPQPRTR